MEPRDEESDEDFIREMMEDEEAFFAMGDVVYNACYIEYVLEDWPLLTQLTDAEKERIYDEFAEALMAAQSPPQVIGAAGANLHLVVHHNLEMSIENVYQLLDAVCGHIVQRYPNQGGPQEWGGSSIGPRDIPEAVIRIGGKLYGDNASDTGKQAGK